MNDTIRLVQSKQISQGIAVADVNFVKAKFCVGLQPCQTRLLQRHILIIIEIINANDLVTKVKQTQCAIHANEPSSAGDERFQTKLQVKSTALQHSKRNHTHQNI
jgi:hypothetical protein